MHRRHLTSILLCALFSSSTTYAGDVQALLFEGDLRITGDDTGNRFIVSEAENGNVSVVGRPGTTINGTPAVTFPVPALDSLRIALGAGSDSVALGGLQLPGDLVITSVDGGVQVTHTLTAISLGGRYVVDFGDGSGSMEIRAVTVGADMNLQGGRTGGIFARVFDVDTGGDLRITDTAESAFPTLTLLSGDLNIGGVIDVFSLRGNASLLVEDSLLGGVMTRSPAASMGIQIQNVVVTGDIDVVGGIDYDGLGLFDVAVQGDVRSLMGAGEDFFSMAGLTVEGSLLFDGGRGSDRLVDGGFEALGGVTLRSIEIIELP